MARQVKRLSGLDIDEVSLVDTPANQHGMIAFSKAHQEDDMPDLLFDAEGNEIDDGVVLEEGDLVYTEQGEELRVSYGPEDDEDDDEDQGFVDEYDEDYEDELAEVGKALPARVRAAGRLVRSRASDEKLATQMFAGRHGARARRAANGAVGGLGQRGAATAREAGERAGRRGRSAATAAGMQYRAIPAGGRAGIRYGGTAAAAGGGSVYVDRKVRKGLVRKSAGQRFLDEISKAYSDEERDDVFASFLDQVDSVSKRNDQLEDVIAEMLEEREAEQFTTVAKGYEFGDAGTVGGILQRMAHYAPPEDLREVHRLLSSAGQVSKQLFTEQGVYGGGAPSSIMDQVLQIAGDAVAKSAQGMSEAEAVTAVFSANPDAYDEYLREQYDNMTPQQRYGI